MGLLDKILTKIVKNKVKNALKNPKEFKEKLDDAMVKVLRKVDDSERVDELETKLIIAGIQATQSYLGVRILDEDARKVVAEKAVEWIGKINLKLQDHLEN